MMPTPRRRHVRDGLAVAVLAAVSQPAVDRPAVAQGNVDAAQGTSVGPICSVVPATSDFGPVILGYGPGAGFRIANAGDGLLTGNVTEVCPEFSIYSGAGPYSLGPGEYRDVWLVFQPSSTGSFTCTVATGCGQDHVSTGQGVIGGACCGGEAGAYDCFTSTGQDCFPPYTYLGDGTACPWFSSGDVFAPTEIGSATTQLVYLKNPGVAPLSGTATIPAGSAFQIMGSGEYWIAPGDSVAFPVRFLPTSAGSHFAMLATDCATCDLVGFGVENSASWDRVALDFGEVPLGSAAEIPVQLQSQGHISGTVHTTCPSFSIVGDGTVDGPGTIFVRFDASVPDSPVGDIVAQIGGGAQTLLLTVVGTGVFASDATATGPAPVPQALALHVPDPNPSRGPVAISYEVPRPGRVRLDVFDVSGRRVATVLHREVAAGVHIASWSGRTQSGERAVAGVYFLRLVSSGEKAVQQLVRLP